MSPRICAEQSSGVLERALVSRGEKYIEHRTLFLAGSANAIRRYRRQSQPICHRQQYLIASLFRTLLMPLQFDVEILPTEYLSKLCETLLSNLHAVVRKPSSQWTIFTASQADQPLRELAEIVERCRTFCLRRLTHLEARDQLTQILITDLRSTEQNNARWIAGLRRTPIAHGNLRANVRSNAEALRRRMKARGTVDTVAIGDRHRIHAQPGRLLD